MNSRIDANDGNANCCVIARAYRNSIVLEKRAQFPENAKYFQACLTITRGRILEWKKRFSSKISISEMENIFKVKSMYIYICAQEEREAIRSIFKAIKKKRPPSAAAVAALGASIHLIILGCNVKLTGERQTVRGGKYV